MRVVRWSSPRSDRNHPSKCLVVFLPGFGDDAEVFDEHGFNDALRARSLVVDTASAQATFGYYMRRTVLDRLRNDVLLPAKGAGYQQIWLVGISMGGMGVLLAMSKESSVNIAGGLLLAPYLGDDSLLREIDRAGGLARWSPLASVNDDYQRDVWRFLKKATDQSASSPSIYLGAGDRDKLSFGHRILAAALPRNHVFATPGRHDWGPWGTLWAQFLDQSDFRTRCDASDP